MSLVPVPSEQDARRAPTAARRSSPTSATACPAAARLAGAPGLPRRARRAIAAGPARARRLGRPATIEMTPGGLRADREASGADGWLRRNSGLLGAAGRARAVPARRAAGRPLGQPGRTKVPAKQVKVEGLGALGTVGGAAASDDDDADSGPRAPAERAKRRSPRQEGRRSRRSAKETKAEKAPPPKADQTSPRAKINKLTNSTGKKHQEEINALGAEPIETG